MSKKKKSTRGRKKAMSAALITGLILVVGALAYFGYEWWKFRRSRFVTYPEFGIPIPHPYSIHGIDVSKYQENISWESVKAMEVGPIRLQFAFIKATEGIGNVDRHFKRNWKKSREAGITRGAYHFFLATKDGKQQAQNFIKRVDLEPGDLPPVLDVEQTYGVANAVIKREVKEWLQVVEGYYKVKPILYTNVDFYNRQLGADFDDYPLWIAHYLQPNKPRIERDWAFWQHSETGRVNGIFSKVDFNVFNGDSADFVELLYKAN